METQLATLLRKVDALRRELIAARNLLENPATKAEMGVAVTHLQAVATTIKQIQSNSVLMTIPTDFVRSAADSPLRPIHHYQNLLCQHLSQTNTEWVAWDRDTTTVKLAPMHSRPAARWFRIAMNRDVSTGSLARPFARTAHSYARSPVLASLARSAALIRSFARSLTHSRARGRVND